MAYSLADKKVLIIGGGSGIARRIATDSAALGARIVLAGRTPAHLEPTAEVLRRDGHEVDTVRLDLTDESSIAAAAQQVGTVDHLVALAADHANGPVADLDAAAVTQAFDAKVIGPILLAKHFGGRIAAGGSMLLFSGVAAYKPAAGLTVMATTNGAVSFLAEALAVELTPIRVNALSPGIIDSGAWDKLGTQQREEMFAQTAAANPVGRVGTTEDVAAAAVSLLTNGFITGTTLHVDGGGHLG